MEKIGGFIVRDPSREKLEDLISIMDLIDVHPSKGKYMWNNKRYGPRHIATRLDHFLILISFLSLPESISSHSIPWEISDHHPISLYFLKEENVGTIPFHFNPLCMDNLELFPLVYHSWCQWIFGSPIHIWKNKLKLTKDAIKNWVNMY
jgi:hypothetical protein